MNEWIVSAKELISFNPSEIIVKKPELIFRTIYDNMLEKKIADMYPSQKEIFQFVTTNNKYLALVHTMLGSGKTSMILPLCGWLLDNKKTIKNKLLCIIKI